MKLTNKSIVEEFAWGVYVLQMPTGEVVADADDNFLCIESAKGDLRRISKLMDAARHYGVGNATPVFLSGRRQISEQEFIEQVDRAEAGLVADPNDPGVILDGLRGRSYGG